MNFHENYKCRFCMSSSELKPEIEFLDINENVEQLFFDLTQVKLKFFANCICTKVCEICLKDLNHCIELKNLLIDTQNELERNIKFNEIESEVKVEEHDEDEEIYSDILEVNNELAECPECLELVNQNVITKHIKKHMKESSFVCDKCDYTTDKSSRLEKHCMKIHKSDPPKRLKKKIESRIRKQCTLCGSLVKNLVEHLKITHGQLKRFHCDKCEYKCYFRAKIERHLQRHIPKEFRLAFNCSECDFQSHRKDCLKNHMLTMHKTDRQRNETCIHCDKSFFNKSQLNTHIKSVHQKIKNNLCNYCGKSFYTAKDLQMHEKRHFEKKEKCTECDSLFFCKIDLRRHYKNKHTMPNVICEYADCGRKFHSNFKLKLHVKTIHERQKEYACSYSYCENKFAQYNNLKRHIDTVHKALRINCLVDNCKYSVSRKDKYKTHLMNAHKNLDDNTREIIFKGVKYA